MKNRLPHLWRALMLACALFVYSESVFAQLSPSAETSVSTSDKAPASAYASSSDDPSFAAFTQSSMHKQGKARRAERHRIDGKENMIYLSFGTALTSYNSINTYFAIEYSRQIVGNLFWGANFSTDFALGRFLTYDYSPGGSDPYSNTVKQNIYKLDGMIFYRLPVISDRLYFRVGMGLGLGYHHIIPSDYTQIKDKVLPYINLEAAWVLRLARNVEMKFSPLIILTPSEVAISPVRLGPPTDVVACIFNPGFNITVGCRF